MQLPVSRIHFSVQILNFFLRELSVVHLEFIHVDTCVNHSSILRTPPNSGRTIACGYVAIAIASPLLSVVPDVSPVLISSDTQSKSMVHKDTVYPSSRLHDLHGIITVRFVQFVPK